MFTVGVEVPSEPFFPSSECVGMHDLGLGNHLQVFEGYELYWEFQ